MLDSAPVFEDADALAEERLVIGTARLDQIRMLALLRNEEADIDSSRDGDLQRRLHGPARHEIARGNPEPLLRRADERQVDAQHRVIILVRARTQHLHGR